MKENNSETGYEIKKADNFLSPEARMAIEKYGISLGEIVEAYLMKEESERNAREAEKILSEPCGSCGTDPISRKIIGMAKIMPVLKDVMTLSFYYRLCLDSPAPDPEDVLRIRDDVKRKLRKTVLFPNVAMAIVYYELSRRNTFRIGELKFERDDLAPELAKNPAEIAIAAEKLIKEVEQYDTELKPYLIPLEETAREKESKQPLQQERA